MAALQQMMLSSRPQAPVVVNAGSVGTGTSAYVPPRVAGDLLVLVTCSNSTMTTPGGYTALISNQGVNKLCVFYRIADGSESTPLTLPVASVYSCISVFRGVNQTSPIDSSGTLGIHTVGNGASAMSSATFSTSGSPTRLIQCFVSVGSGNNGWGWLSTDANNIVENLANVGTLLAIASSDFNTQGTTTAASYRPNLTGYTMTCNSFSFAIKP